MLPDNINEVPPDILCGVLKLMNINIEEFMYNLINDKPREIKIYARIYMLYHENTEHNKNIESKD